MKITISESKWNGSSYNVVDPYLRSWDVDENEVTWRRLEEWCEQSFGPRGDVWRPTAERWYCNDGKFFFKRNSDLTLFLIKWS